MTRLEKKQIIETSLRDLETRLAEKKIKNLEHSEVCSRYNKAVKNGVIRPAPAARVKRSDGSIL